MSGAFCCIAMARIKLKNSQVKDKAPLATDLDVGGEIAVNHHADNPGIFLKDTAGAVRKIAGPGSISTSAATEAAAGIVELATLAETATGTDATRAVHPAGLKALLSATLTPGSATAPAGPATGATYIDSSVSPAVVAVWDGAAWVTQVGTATTSATAPTAPVTGQVYLDTSTSPAVAKLWNGAAWINLTTDTAVQSKLDAQLGGIWTRTGTVVSPANAGDQVHAATGRLTAGGTAAAPNIEIKADGGIVANTDGLVYAAATKRLAIGSTGLSTTLNIGSSATGGFDGGVLLNRGPATTNFYEASDGTNSIILGLDNTLTVAKLGSVNSYPIGLFAGNSERLRVNPSGQIGMGTSSPSTNLHIGLGAAGGDLGVLLSRGATTNLFEAHDGTKTFAAGTDSANAFVKVGSLSNHPVSIVQNNLEAIYIDTSKRVVIGASSVLNASTAKLQCATTANITTAVYADNTAALAGGLVAGDIYRKADGTLMITF